VRLLCIVCCQGSNTDSGMRLGRVHAESALHGVLSDIPATHCECIRAVAVLPVQSLWHLHMLEDAAGFPAVGVATMAV
jgi:hypothetical protein